MIIQLLTPFFRQKKKIVLLTLVFCLLFFSLFCFLQYRENLSIEIAQIKNRKENRTLVVSIEANQDVDPITSIQYVKHFEVLNPTEDLKLGMVEVDVEDHVSQVQEQLKKLGWNPFLDNGSISSELASYKMLETVMQILIISLILFYTVVIFLQIRLFILWETNDIALLKVLGYRLGFIENITLLKIYVLIVGSYLLSFFWFLLVNVIWFHFKINFFLPLFMFLFFSLILYCEKMFLRRKTKKIFIQSVLS